MFVKYDCGCIGFIHNDACWCVRACDSGEYNPIRFMNRHASLSEKKYELLSTEELGMLAEEINELLFYGDKLLDLKMVLKD